jgi:hypothetical protein
VEEVRLEYLPLWDQCEKQSMAASYFPPFRRCVDQWVAGTLE